MSTTAEEHVKACTHPDVKGGTRTLYEAIAKLIPEGQTATPVIPISALARAARQGRRTTQRHRNVLERIGEISVMDGGRGKKASFEMLHLIKGRAVTNTPLPLVGAVPRRSRPRHAPSADAPTLFDQPPTDQPDESPANIGQSGTRWRLQWLHNVCQLGLRWFARLRNVGQSGTRWTQTYANLAHVGAGTDRGLKISSRRSEEVEDRARGPADDFLTWWLATFSPHQKFRPDSAIDRQRDGPKIVDLLTSRTVEVLQPLARLMWDIHSDGVTDSNRDWIAKSNHSITVFHRKIQFLEEERDRLAAGIQQPPPERDVWARIFERLDTKMNRHERFESFGLMRLHSIGRDADGEVIQVAGPEPHIEWVTKHHLAAVHEAVAEVRPGARVEFVAVDAAQRKSGTG